MSTTTARPARPDTRTRISEASARLSGGVWARWALLVELAGAFVLHVMYRGHDYLEGLDEAAHATVAEHLAAHPLVPTLYEVGALSQADSFDWSQYHVWVHIPPLGMWASAAAIRILGATPFADRLPGLFFVLGGMVAVYLLGSRLFGAGVGLVGAAFAGFAPYALLISQGYFFGDITDTPLMLLAPLAVVGIVLAYQTGKLRWLALAGAAQGLAYLDKGMLSLATAAILVALFACERLFPAERGWARVGWRGLAVFAGSLIVTAVPYTLYAALAFPGPSAIESQRWKDNLFTSSEGWGRPLDYHFTALLYTLYGPALALLLLTAGVVVTVVALRRRARADLVIAVWLVAVYAPLTLAVSKAAPFTYPAIPAVGLAVGRLVQLGLRAGPGTGWSERIRRASPVLARFLNGRVLTLGLLLGTAIAPFELTSPLAPFQTNYATLEAPDLLVPAGQTLLDRLVPYLCVFGASVVATCLIAVLGTFLERYLSDAGSGLQVEQALTAALVGFTVLLLGSYWLSADVAAIAAVPARTQPFVGQTLGADLARQTPSDATLIAARKDPLGLFHLVVMFWSDRDVYVEPDLSETRVCVLAQQAAAAGSPLYVLASARDLPASASAWPLRGLLEGGRWGIYQPRCAGGG